MEKTDKDYFKKLAVIETPKMKRRESNDNYEELCALYCKIRNLAKDALTGESAKRKVSGLLKKAGAQNLIPIDKKGFPTKEGIYLAESRSLGLMRIDVYPFDTKGLCCFAEDFGSEGSGVNDATDCHVSVQNTGLEFIIKVGELDHALD